MKQITTTITQRGQVTIPAEVRRVLGLEPSDKVTFVIDDATVRLTTAEFTLESAFGSVSPLPDIADLDEQISAAKEERAVHSVRNLAQQ
jgi:antitoxin PrlF